MKKRSVLSNIGYIIRQAAADHFILLVIMAVVGLAQGLCTMILPVVSGTVIGIAERGLGLRALLIWGGAVSAAAVLLFVLAAVLANKTDWHIEYVRCRFIERRVRKAYTLEYSMLERSDILDLQRRAVEADQGSGMGLSGMFTALQRLLVNLVGVLAAAIVLATYNLALIGSIFAVCIIRMLVMNAAKTYDKKYVWDMMAPFWRRIEYLYRIVTDTSCAKDIRLYAMQDWLNDHHQKVSGQAHELMGKSALNWMRFSIINQFLVFVTDCILYGWLIYSAVTGKISIADFSLCYGSIYSLINSINLFFESCVELRQFSLHVDDYRSFLELPEGDSGGNGLSVPDCSEYSVEFRNVSFKYPGREDYALRNVNLTVEAGRRLAVVGINGAGKTTLIKLLLRLYEPTEGEIYLNGINILDFDRAEYYSLFAPVFQNSEVLYFSVLENITMEREELSDIERAGECIDSAGLSDKLAALKGGITAHLGRGIHDDGMDFSGGERQKLMLARALYKSAPIVVLDEPTAALDALAESRQYESFDGLIGSKTAIYVSHRLSSTKFCDSIVMFDGGEVVEYGSHEELLAKNGRYAELFNVQAQYYTQGGMDCEKQV